MVATSTVVKRCVTCGKDVTNDKRMKDSQGKYWCIACGTEDQKKKAHSGDTCTSCGEHFPTAQLAKMGHSKLCKSCLKARQKSPGLMERFKAGGSDAGEKARLVKMLAAMALLALVAVWQYMGHAH